MHMIMMLDLKWNFLTSYQSGIWYSHSSVDKRSSFHGCCLTSTGKQIPTFRRNMTPSPLRSNNPLFIHCLKLKVKVTCSFETSVPVYQSTWRDNQGELNLHGTVRTGTNMQQAEITELCQEARAFVLKKVCFCFSKLLPSPPTPPTHLRTTRCCDLNKNSLIHIVRFDFLAARTKNSIIVPGMLCRLVL
jgi:hypothetical protein